MHDFTSSARVTNVNYLFTKKSTSVLIPTITNYNNYYNL